MSWVNKYNYFLKFKKNIKLFNIQNYLKGAASNELVLKSALFQNHSAILYWKIEFKATVNQALNGLSSLTLKINQLPKDGSCYVDKLNGTSMLTNFFVKCIFWSDPDGSVDKYEFYGKMYFFYTFLFMLLIF